MGAKSPRFQCSVGRFVRAAARLYRKRGPSSAEKEPAMQLLAKQDLIATGPVDHADWNYSGLLAYVMRRRFHLIAKLLGPRSVARLLEIGFGSGVFMPYLSSRCGELYGIDVHPHVDDVRETLSRSGVRASLSRQDAAHMRFPDRFFDAVVCVSALEFVEDIEACAGEIARVLRGGGRLVAVMPASSRVLDFLLFALTGADARKDYANRRERVLPALLERFNVVRSAAFGPIYRAYSLEVRS